MIANLYVSEEDVFSFEETTSFPYVSFRTGAARDFINRVFSLHRITLVFGMDEHSTKNDIRFHCSKEIVFL